MDKATELKMVINMAEGKKATQVKLVEGGKSIEITYSVLDAISNSTVPEDDFERKFPIVEASKLSREDEFLKYEPTTIRQKRLKEILTVEIKYGLKDFRRPAMDPSFKNGKIVYEAGLMPVTGKSCHWWYENAKKFMPERNSRLGTKTQYVAFLGVLIKYLINKGYTVSQAWQAVCDDSKKMGHYLNSENAKHSFEATGCRQIGLFYDLANTHKILGNYDGSVYKLASGYYDNDSNYFALAFMLTEDNPDYCYDNAVGWLVLDA